MTDNGLMMKVHGTGRNGVMALCDPDLLGKEFIDGEVRFKVTDDFYGGSIVDADVVIRMAVISGSVNAFGNRSVALLVDNGLADIEQVTEISGIPHIQIYNMFP